MGHIRECQQCGKTYVPANGPCPCADRPNPLDRYLSPNWREQAAEAGEYWRKTFQGGAAPAPKDEPQSPEFWQSQATRARRVGKL